MSMLPEDVKISLKVMTNKQKTKVLFAEADSKFAEIILSFLTLPLGEIVKILMKRYGDKSPVVGSLNTLYTGLTNLESDNFWTGGGKKMLLNPINSFKNAPIKHFRCGDIDCRGKSSPNVSLYYDSGICDCGKPLNQAMGEIELKSRAGGDGNILVEGLHFLVTDDLKLAPYEPGSMIQTLINLGIVVTEGAEQLDATLGYNEIVDLLKGSLLSKTPLTDTILGVGNKNTDYGLLENMEQLSSISSWRSMTVTALIQKSSNKLLFVEASESFVDFILSFLTIPLGKVESLLRGKTRFKSIDNLYNSTTSFINGKHLITRDAKRRLQEPELPPYYVSENYLFSLSEQIAPPIYYHSSITDSSGRRVEKGIWMRYKDPKGDRGCYAKHKSLNDGLFVIYDDLTIKSTYVEDVLMVPSCDIMDMMVRIGLNEGLSILAAALTSTSALTDGLIKPITAKASSVALKTPSVALNSSSKKRQRTNVKR